MDMKQKTSSADDTAFVEALAYLHGIETAIISLSRHPQATRELLYELCYAYDYVDNPGRRFDKLPGDTTGKADTNEH